MFPSPPPLSHRNAVSELLTTPLRPKTASVPLEGRVLRAATLDAELSTELEDATLFEVAGQKTSYIAHWCELSQLDGIDQIKAKDLKIRHGSLYSKGRWEPTLIPKMLRQSAELEAASNSSSSVSKTQKATPSHASKSKPTTSTKQRGRKRSLRRETIVRDIGTTSQQETIEATVIPIPGAEEGSVALWLNQIISCFDSPGTSQVHPDGSDGPRLTRSAAARKAAKTKSPLRAWSAQYSKAPVEDSALTIKPDIVFCDRLNSKSGFAWRNVISFLELTSSEQSAQLRRNITRKAYAMFMSQPHRRFVVALSIASQYFHLHLFDRSGVIHTLGHNLHKAADTFARIMYVLACGSAAVLGFDPTFHDPTIGIYHPIACFVTRKTQVLKVRGNNYRIVRPLFASPLIRGRGTSSWLVKLDKKKYVVKDYWTHQGRKVKEEEVLGRIAGLWGVPQLADAWTVQINGADETTDLLRPKSLFNHKTFETRIHRRLLLETIGEPLVNFSSLQEMISIFIDIVRVHYQLVTVYHVLHRDISFYNILMFVCETPWPATSPDEVEQENVIAQQKYRRGLLIDFDYASLLDIEKQGASSGDRTGTIPFMALDVLQQHINPRDDFVYTISHDLESLIYVIVWICVVYQAPNEPRTDKAVEDTSLRRWAAAKNVGDIRDLYDQKLGQLMSGSALEHFTPYFAPMKPFVASLYALIQKSREESKSSVLTHIAVEDILMEAFNKVSEPSSCGAANAKRTWEKLQEEPAVPKGRYYYSEGRNIRRRVS